MPVRVASVPVGLPPRAASVSRFEPVDSSEEDITHIPEGDEEQEEQDEENDEQDDETDTGKQISILGTVKSKGKASSSSSSSSSQSKRSSGSLKPLKLALKL